MSAATKSRTPLRPAASAAPMAPPVGPEPSRETACRCTDCVGMSPPLDCMRTTSPPNPDARSLSARRST
jgi:hypothetical protein